MPDHALKVGDPDLALAPAVECGEHLRYSVHTLLTPTGEDLGLQPVLPTDLSLALDAGELLEHNPGLELRCKRSMLRHSGSPFVGLIPRELS